VIHFKAGTYSPSPAGRTLNQRLPFFYCGTIKSPPERPCQYSAFDACAPLLCGYAWKVLHKRRSAASSLHSVILLLLPPRSPIHAQGVEFRLLRGPQREDRSAIDLDSVFRRGLQPTSSDAQAQFVAYSNDVISVSKIALVGKNGLVVALAFDRNALIHGWACHQMAYGSGHKGSRSFRTSRIGLCAAGGRMWRLRECGRWTSEPL